MGDATDLRARRIQICREIAADMEADTNRREGMELTGHNMAVALGEICGTIAALALLVAQMDEESAVTERTDVPEHVTDAAKATFGDTWGTGYDGVVGS